MTTKAVIFDLDGTLLNTVKDLTAAVNYALGRKGLRARSADEVRQFLGNGIALLVKRSAGDGFDEDFYRTALADFTAYYHAHLSVYTRPYEGIVPLLKELNRRNILCAVVSNKKDCMAASLCGSLLPGLLSFVTGERAGLPRKPDPALVTLALSALGVSKDECLYVGDSDVDVETARAAQIRLCAVSWGFRSKEELLAAGKIDIIDHPCDLLSYL